jgi:alkylation response protein AidB-like acyl-CoA dehydrogenase
MLRPGVEQDPAMSITRRDDLSPPLAVAGELADVFRERLTAELATGMAGFPQRNVDDLIAAGLLLLAVPVEAGGLGATLETYCGVVEELATGSPATALLLTMPVGWAALFLYPEECVPDAHRSAYREHRDWIFDEARAGHVFAAGNSEPGIAVMQDSQTRAAPWYGAWRLSGRKVFGSWGTHSDWLFSTARLPEGALPDAGAVEFFCLPTQGAGVHWANDWNSFGMAETASHSFDLREAPARGPMGFPGFATAPNPDYWWRLGFAAVALGCVRGLLAPLIERAGALGPAARSELAGLTARYESARAYLMDTARRGDPLSTPLYSARALRAKTHVTQEAVALASTLFSLGSGSALAANGLAAKYLRDVFAGTGLRPPYKASLDMWGERLEGWSTE